MRCTTPPVGGAHIIILQSFSSNSGVTASFGEMLLLIAIHFHSGQLAAVGELVCATLGMRVPVRPNGLARIKQAFTQEIFTEQASNRIYYHCE